MNQFAPCPKCNYANAQKMTFTWWGGILGPKLLTHVKCQTCGTTYNGKTGRDNTSNIIIYSVVVGAICLGLIVFLFAIAIFLVAVSR